MATNIIKTAYLPDSSYFQVNKKKTGVKDMQ